LKPHKYYIVIVFDQTMAGNRDCHELNQK